MVFGPLGIGIVDESALVFGTETGIMLAVDAANGESLAESEEYTERIDALPDDPLASAFIEPASAIEAAIASGDLDPAQAQMLEPLLDGPLSQPISAALSATSETASLDVTATVDPDVALSTESSLLAELPGGSWLATAVPDLGDTLTHVLDQVSSSGLPGAGELERQVQDATGLDLSDDVLGWLGDAAVFVQGTAAPGFSAGLIAETDDSEAPRAALEVLERFAERDSGFESSGPPEGADYGFSIGIPGIGGGAEAGGFGDQVVAVIGATAEQALEPSERLGDDPAYQEAVESLGEDLAPALYVDLPSFFEVAETGSDGDVDYEEVRPYADALATLIAGGKVEDGLALSRITVSLADE